jgi:ligand-binding sensor domain-containing protein
LSKYNEKTNEFNFVPALKGINGFVKDSGGATTWNKILLVKNSFWLFVQNDAIYSYDLNKSTLTKHLLLPKLEIQYIKASQDGDNFYLQVDEGIISSPYVMEGEYLLYTSTDNKITKLSTPDKLPASGSILVDSNDNLWASAVGYYTPNNTWEKIYKPSVKDFFDMLFEGNLSFSFPEIILESPKNHLWFRSSSGIAWLNTETLTGCWVTDYGASDIKADTQGQLWMIVNGHLYKHLAID